MTRWWDVQYMRSAESASEQVFVTVKLRAPSAEAAMTNAKFMLVEPDQYELTGVTVSE